MVEAEKSDNTSSDSDEAETETEEGESDPEIDSEPAAIDENDTPNVEETIELSDEIVAWEQTQEILGQSLLAIDLVRKELDLRQLDVQIEQAAAAGVSQDELARAKTRRNEAANEISDLRASIDPDRDNSIGIG